MAGDVYDLRLRCSRFAGRSQVDVLLTHWGFCGRLGLICHLLLDRYPNQRFEFVGVTEYLLFGSLFGMY